MNIQVCNTSLCRSFTALLLTVLLAACQATGGVSGDGLAADTSAAAPGPKYQEFIAPGDVLPIESIVDVNGETIDLATPHKRKLVILFATWCKDSNRTLKAMNKSELLADDSIEVIAIAREETVETVVEWRDKHGIKTPLAADPDRSIYKRFAAAGVPRLITVSADNKVIKMNLAEVEDPLSLIEWQ